MKSRFVHILILLLVLFQNSWAMEQTYRTVCDNFETSHGLEVSEQNNTAEHKHHCNHRGSPIVGIIQLNVETNITLDHFYPEIPSKHLHSISNKPAIPPPIV